MATIDEIKQKYLGDDSFSKAANEVSHSLKKFKTKEALGTSGARRLYGIEMAKAFAQNNKFKNAEVSYRTNDGWSVFGRLSGYMTPTEAQAYAQDLLKAVAAIKKAPAIKK